MHQHERNLDNYVPDAYIADQKYWAPSAAHPNNQEKRAAFGAIKPNSVTFSPSTP